VGALAAEARLPRVCLTGGEPFLQAEGLAALVADLQVRGRLVHIESNATLELPAGLVPDWLTLSPKPPDYRVAPSLVTHAGEVKVVVDADFGEEALRRIQALAEEMPRAEICLQPEASGGQATIRRALGLVMEHPQWRLSLQLHKLLGIR
jgi:organic radical activating enzyme